MDTLGQATPELLQLFDDSIPGMPMLFSVLEGRSPADIRVDDERRPMQCLVRSRLGVTFASRGISPVFLDEAIACLRSTGGLGLVLPPEGISGWTPPAPDMTIGRLEFRALDTESGGFRAILQQPLAGMEVRPIDRKAVESCLWKDMLVAFCGTTDAFLSLGFGLSLRRGEEILAEGYAPVPARSTMEIGVMTAEPHRGKGYGTLVSAYVIDECLKRGHSLFWSCELDNPASAVLARKLGFCDERTYQIFAYRSTKQ